MAPATSAFSPEPGEPTQSIPRDAGSEDAWALFALRGAEEVEHYGDFGSMVEGANAVAVVEVVSVAPGRILGLDDLEGGGAIQYVSVKLRPKEVIAERGPLAADDEGLVTLEIGPVVPGLELEGIEKEMVGDTLLVFLHRKGTPIPGVPDSASSLEEFKLGVYRLVSSQGLFLKSGDEVVAAVYADTGFPSDVTGESFEETVDLVRARA
jgi:hypothetical protein